MRTGCQTPWIKRAEMGTAMKKVWSSTELTQTIINKHLTTDNQHPTPNTGHPTTDTRHPTTRNQQQLLTVHSKNQLMFLWHLTQKSFFCGQIIAPVLLHPFLWQSNECYDIPHQDTLVSTLFIALNSLLYIEHTLHIFLPSIHQQFNINIYKT